MSCVVKLPRSIWEPFKSEFLDIPQEVLHRLLDAIEIKVQAAAEARSPIPMIWTCTHCGSQYTASVQLEVIYKPEFRLVASLRGTFYVVDLPTLGLDA